MLVIYELLRTPTRFSTHDVLWGLESMGISSSDVAIIDFACSYSFPLTFNSLVLRSSSICAIKLQIQALKTIIILNCYI